MKSSSPLSYSRRLFPRLNSAVQAAEIALLVLAALTASALGEGAKAFRAARLTYIAGEVRVELANSTANSVAVLNMPLVEGTVISAGADGQAEIEFEDGSLARITPNSGLSLLNLSVDSSGTYQTRIAILGGLTYLELRAGTKYIYRVDAGGNTLSPVENATIRVNFDEAPASIAVLDGSVHIAAADGEGVDANAGQTVRNDAGSKADSDAGSAGGLYMVKSGIAPESWDRWNEDRDEAAAREEGLQTDVRAKFAGNQGYGWSDLDASGSWYDIPGHGKVWQPDLATNPQGTAADGDAATQEAANQNVESGDPDDQSGFDPYGYGSWAWTSAGYSWASGYGWGWLPYRCGQWGYYDGFGWGWSPSPYCAVFGFGGYGYGGFNLGHVPGGYKRPHRPVPGPGPIHPILRRHAGAVPIAPVHQPGIDRVIAGNTVHPVQPVGSGFVIGGNALGAGLRRDYPVDSETHAPVLGLVATHGEAAAGSTVRAAWQPGGLTNGQSRAAYPYRPMYEQQGGNLPVRGGSQTARSSYQPGGAQNEVGGRPAPVIRPPQPYPAQRPSAPSAPRYSPPPPPAPASHSTPAASPSAAKGK